MATWIEVIVILVAAVVAVIQLSQIRSALTSSAAASIFGQQLEVNKLFLQDDNHRLVPYFFEGKNIPAGEIETRQKAGGIAGSILDHFSHLEDQANAGSFEIDEGWEAYMRSSFETSPILCEMLRGNLDFYGGEESYLWNTFARDTCKAQPG